MIDRVVGEGNTALGWGVGEGTPGREPPAFEGSLDTADPKDGWFMVNNVIIVLVFVGYYYYCYYHRLHIHY